MSCYIAKQQSRCDRCIMDISGYQEVDISGEENPVLVPIYVVNPDSLLSSESYLETINKLITNTVRVSESEYIMNLSSMHVSQNIIEKANFSKPVPKVGLRNILQWNQSSDRAYPSKVSSKWVNVPTRGNTKHTSITRCRPGSSGPSGQGVDIKHNSYQRYILKKKGLIHLRGEKTIPTMMNNKKIVNNKFRKDSILSKNYRCSECNQQYQQQYQQILYV